ncbi:AAA family ATPase [Microlunatus soli]|uniref:AAA ATPase domain-containing protein n=1 Tax=Microlunatus soli TaxID=630515 RepID=A0A1H1P486_9ACTN|nr:AAA family ATPase [Microlunatus soli]SDS06086.1 AAA ATPase domain-containing protein [Microlunatus soli]
MDDFVINRADEYGRSIYLRDRPANARSVIFTGAPGSGKSFVLRHAAEQARAAGDLVIRIDASSREPLQSRMTRAIGDQLEQLKRETPVGANRLLNRLYKTLDTMLSNRFDIQHAISGSLSWWPPLRIAFTRGRDQQFERPTSSMNDLADRLGDLAADRGKQVMVLIDSLDRAQEGDLAAINELATHLDGSERPVNLTVAASQPALDKLLVAAMPEGLASGAAHCYDVRNCGPVPDAELRPALTARIARSGAAVLPDAADRLVAEANGDPGRLLRLADQATDLATGPHGVTTDTATAAITRLRHDDAWIYNAGWNNLTGRAKAILADAAADPTGGSIADLNTGIDADEWAERDAARNELIGAGFVRESEGTLVVADPGLQQWITDHTGSRPSLSTPDDNATEKDADGKSPATKDAATKDPATKDAATKDPVTKEAGDKSPAKKSPTDKSPAKAASVKKDGAAEPTAKSDAAEKSAAEKAAAKTSTAKKSPVEKSPVEKSPVEKSPVEKSPVEKSPVKKSTAKKSTAKKSTAKKSTAKKSAQATGNRTVTMSNTKPSRSKPSASKTSTTKTSRTKINNQKSSSAAKTASKSSATAGAATKRPAAKSVRPVTDLHAVQPPVARTLSARRPAVRSVAQPTGRAS